ncbi:MAG TPA: hypothetical protein VKN99_25490 [Polyangia bacterium]|nr:hypothetical protein [Polyangia bacterium]
MRSLLALATIVAVVTGCGDDTGTPLGGHDGAVDSGGSGGSGGAGGSGGTGGLGGGGGSGGSGGVGGSGGSGGTGGAGGSDGGLVMCDPNGGCPMGMRCCPCTNTCYFAGCLSCCMFCRPDGGFRQCGPDCSRCSTGGPCCGPNQCCAAGEWCDMSDPIAPRCRCGDGDACSGQERCCSAGPIGTDACGSFCGSICPLSPRP